MQDMKNWIIEGDIENSCAKIYDPDKRPMTTEEGRRMLEIITSLASRFSTDVLGNGAYNKIVNMAIELREDLSK